MALRRIDISRPANVLGLAAESTAGTEIWLANLTNKEETICLDASNVEIACLNADNFVEASRRPGLLDRDAMSPNRPEFQLSSYALARLRIY